MAGGQWTGAGGGGGGAAMARGGGSSVAGRRGAGPAPKVTPEIRMKNAIKSSDLEAMSATRVGGGHINDAFHLVTPDGKEYLFKPAEGERGDVHRGMMDTKLGSDRKTIVEGATLAEREVVAATIGSVLGIDEYVPGARLGMIAKYDPTKAAPAPPKTPEPIPQGDLHAADRLAIVDAKIAAFEVQLGQPNKTARAADPTQNARDWNAHLALLNERDRIQDELRSHGTPVLKGTPDFPQTKPPAETGQPIGTTGGPFDWNQRKDAWGRPIVIGERPLGPHGANVAKGRLVNEPSAKDNLTWKNGAWVKGKTAGGPETPPSISSPSTPASSTSDREGAEAWGRNGAVIDWRKAQSPADIGRAVRGSVEDRATISAFDVIIGNMDRHGGNYMIEDGTKMIAIDHGYSFPSATKAGNPYGRGELRSFMMPTGLSSPSVAWEKTMADKVAAVNWGTLLKGSPLSVGEISAVQARANLLVKEFKKGTGKGLMAVQKVLQFDY
jgi:hypothetical protein